MADSGTPTPQIDSMESVPFPSVPESGMDLQQAASKAMGEGGQGEAGGGEGGEGEPPLIDAKDVQLENHHHDHHEKHFHPKNGCQKCCGKIMHLFANDAIYGSFVGPHPVSFFCVCKCCKKWISRDCARPFCVASIVTKMMNFIMLAVVTLLSCFFIFPWAVTFVTHSATQIDSFFPCNDKMIKHHYGNGGCSANAGYYMTYRVFLAFGFVMMTNCFAMADVTSTTDDPYRQRIHHGFWMYKYIYLFVLLMIFFLFLHGSHDPKGYFEFTMHILGNLAHVAFSLVEITVILDIVEIWVVSIALTNNSWANFLYSLVTIVIFIANILCFLSIFYHFSHELKFDILELKNKAHRYEYLERYGGMVPSTSTEVPTVGVSTTERNIRQELINSTRSVGNYTAKWPHTNCVDGTWGKEDWYHIGLMIGMGGVIAALVVVMALKKRYTKRYPFQGWLQVAVITLFDVFYLWSALYNSENVNSRPRCNWALKSGQTYDSLTTKHLYTPHEVLQAGSQETYFRYTGFFHGMIAVFTLIYYAFVHGPRSKTAPLSLAFRHFFTGGYDRIPVYPEDEDAPPEFKEAVERLEVWDDEKEKVAQSWSMFYLMMLFGSFSLMMGMTNFTDPQSHQRYNSSEKALTFKYITAICVTVAYMCFLICPCTRVYKAYECPKRKRRLIKKVQMPAEGIDEVQVDDEDAKTIVEIFEEDQEAWYF